MAASLKILPYRLSSQEQIWSMAWARFFIFHAAKAFVDINGVVFFHLGLSTHIQKTTKQGNNKQQTTVVFPTSVERVDQSSNIMRLNVVLFIFTGKAFIILSDVGPLDVSYDVRNAQFPLGFCHKNESVVQLTKHLPRRVEQYRFKSSSESVVLFSLISITKLQEDILLYGVL